MRSAYSGNVDEEWRVSLTACGQSASGKPAFADSVRDLLRSRAGEDVSVTAGKTGVFAGNHAAGQGGGIYNQEFVTLAVAGTPHHRQRGDRRGRRHLRRRRSSHHRHADELPGDRQQARQL
jgi:predicted outer membrane repeat protein